MRFISGLNNRTEGLDSFFDEENDTFEDENTARYDSGSARKAGEPTYEDFINPLTLHGSPYKNKNFEKVNGLELYPGENTGNDSSSKSGSNKNNSVLFGRRNIFLLSPKFLLPFSFAITVLCVISIYLIGSGSNVEYLKSQANAKESLIVRISGEVKNPGIVQIESNKKVADAIEKAGGLTAAADIVNINTERLLTNNEEIKIPAKSSSDTNIPKKDSGERSSSGKTAQACKVNINKANKTELKALKGIGNSIAQRIIDYRKTNGLFASAEDIKNVKGIGNSIFSKNKNDICV